ncbi:MAG: recombination mediator RecR [Clostridiales bacterium]|nr:recombination mediator RecR [Clostridiales bacterium]
MSAVIPAIETLTTQLGKLPGVGRKTAQRYAYHLLGLEEEDALELAEAIRGARAVVRPCPVCGAYTDADLCVYCADPTRQSGLICVVSDPKDVLAMEKTREFRGCYHVLFGSLSPMDGVGAEDLAIPQLLARCRAGGVSEIILATNSDAKGDVTAAYLAGQIKPLGIACTRIARGIPIGGNLEYTDEITLAQALEGRKPL